MKNSTLLKSGKNLKSLKNRKILSTGSLKLIQGGKMLPEGYCGGTGSDSDPYVLESLVIPSGASDGC